MPLLFNGRPSTPKIAIRANVLKYPVQNAPGHNAAYRLGCSDPNRNRKFLFVPDDYSNDFLTTGIGAVSGHAAGEITVETSCVDPPDPFQPVLV
jgi:hypothetical protein